MERSATRSAEVGFAPLSVVGIGAHQDDVELHCLGTLLRDREAAAVADAMSARYVALGAGRDGTLTYSHEAVARVTDVLRAARATVVLAPPPVDYNRDHVVASQVVDQATIMATARAFRTEHEPLERAPRVWYMDVVGAQEWQPTLYVDIGEQFEEKCRILALYESQMENMRVFGGRDLVDTVRVVDAFRGLQAGVDYAEAFRPALQWPRVAVERHLP